MNKQKLTTKDWERLTFSFKKKGFLTQSEKMEIALRDIIDEGLLSGATI